MVLGTSLGSSGWVSVSQGLGDQKGIGPCGLTLPHEHKLPTHRQ